MGKGKVMAEKSEMKSFVLGDDDLFDGINEQAIRCIKMHNIDGMPYRYIADSLGCALGTVRSRINRAKHAILENRRKAVVKN